ncbi:MAG: hypothetical protein COV34_00980 [Candidatus Zambryskibacteria bacterium CG10_big_fil_rev_8_21_14_0_10_42_12]|uniref:Glycosyl transferase family 1 domain-containing protein n=1 Tax=Candidatus Zambryskibacteria bacterium CG10_big_fil_rev_8_21_14_0_10_42_12 TaxID=1975115 RepID=A0A2H0QW49_9BACT|nr:MAG: hypothetical protein COV34_00980 [Candidatus Zambryskibacteria bacterium CG10_big_fil_rev_8_21_14_0_10_42_12]
MNSKTQKVLLISGIVFPEIGGPATYVHNLQKELRRKGFTVDLISYNAFTRKLPIGIRHLALWLQLLVKGLFYDQMWAFDVFSAGVPAYFAAKILKKNFLVRIGGDSLWEAYIARTEEMILLSDFYKEKRQYTLKEKLMSWSIRQVVSGADAVVFSTQWMYDIWKQPYQICKDSVYIIENAYVPYDLRNENNNQVVEGQKIFVCPTRETFFKNKKMLIEVFEQLSKPNDDIALDTKPLSHKEHIRRIKASYAVVIPSLSEVSPNLLLDAMSVGIPYIMTKDSGYAYRFPGCGILVDPRSREDLKHAMTKILDPQIYISLKERAKHVRINRTYADVTLDFEHNFLK